MTFSINVAGANFTKFKASLLPQPSGLKAWYNFGSLAPNSLLNRQVNQSSGSPSAGVTVADKSIGLNTGSGVFTTGMAIPNDYTLAAVVSVPAGTSAVGVLGVAGDRLYIVPSAGDFLVGINQPGGQTSVAKGAAIAVGNFVFIAATVTNVGANRTVMALLGDGVNLRSSFASSSGNHVGAGALLLGGIDAPTVAFKTAFAGVWNRGLTNLQLLEVYKSLQTYYGSSLGNAL